MPVQPLSPPKRGPGRPVDPVLAELRRTQLVRAACKVFAEKGYNATTITDIANEAKLGRASFYIHYQSKRELLDGVFDYIAESGAAGLFDMASRRLDSFAQIAEMVATIVDRSLAVEEQLPGILRVLVHDGMLDRAVAERIFGMGDVFEDWTAARIAEGIDSGVIRADVDPAFAGHALAGIATGALLRILRDQLTTSTRDEYVGSLVKFLQLLAPTAPR